MHRALCSYRIGESIITNADDCRYGGAHRGRRIARTGMPRRSILSVRQECRDPDGDRGFPYGKLNIRLLHFPRRLSSTHSLAAPGCHAGQCKRLPLRCRPCRAQMHPNRFDHYGTSFHVPGRRCRRPGCKARVAGPRIRERGAGERAAGEQLATRNAAAADSRCPRCPCRCVCRPRNGNHN